MSIIEAKNAERLVSRKPVRPVVECPIYVGRDWFDEIIQIVKEQVGNHMVALFVDDHVADLYPDRLEKIHQALPRVREKRIHNRKAKTLDTFCRLQEFLIEHEIHHDDYVISLGGGTIIDVVGFVAATYTRGLNWISIPTTLIAMVDCGIGGKSGINLQNNKNYIGTFYTPKLLLVDLSFLRTLADNHYRAAIPEMLKMAMIDNADFFYELGKATANGSGLAGIKNAEYAFAKTTIEGKARIIETDPYQRHTRVSLLMGHATAHALESASNLNLPHGEAVAIGLAFESTISEKRLMLDPDDRRILVDTLENCGLRTTLPAELKDPMIIDNMRREKRNRGRLVSMVLPYKPGQTIADWPAPQIQLPMDEIWNDLVNYRKING